jgi:hypothetical protein
MENFMIPIPAMSVSRRTLLAGGAAVGASLLFGRMAGAESLGGVARSPFKEYDIATNGISLRKE